MTNEVHSTVVNEILIEFLKNLSGQESGQLKVKLSFSVDLLKAINKKFKTEKDFFEVIPYSVEKSSWNSLIDAINYIKIDEINRSPRSYDKIFIYSIFIAQELVLGISGYKLQKMEIFWGINDTVNKALANKLKNEDLEVSKEFVGQLEFFQNRRAIEIINYNLQNADFQEFINYQKSKNQLNQNIQQQFEYLDTKKSEINKLIAIEKDKAEDLANYLKGIQSDYNFVGLSKGFQDLLRKKTVAKWLLFAGILVMGCIAVSPFLYKIHQISQTNEFSWRNLAWQEIAFGVSFELILIYFFRIILNEYNSIKIQIMQLELRVSLCRFIEKYAEYAKKINDKDGKNNILEKFENLIFSNILADSKDLPSTFDGVEQIGNIIKNMKG